MNPTALLSQLPVPFWLVAGTLVYFALDAWKRRTSAIGLPMLMVLFTVSVWYLVDCFYNDYSLYRLLIGPEALTAAWWEVLLFLLGFGIMAPKVHYWMNGSLPEQRSNLLMLFQFGAGRATDFQKQLDVITKVLTLFWAALLLIALYRTDWDFAGNFAPYLGNKADPWSRGRVGGGFDALISLASYVLVAITATFGVVAALATRKSTLTLAIVVCLLTMPTYIFDRTRSTMLAVLLPGFCAWVFLRLRLPLIFKIGVLALGFMGLEAWLKFVIENRSGFSIAQAFFYNKEIDHTTTSETRHLGLNMFEELGYVNQFIAQGSYKPNWGMRYYAELMNPVPRVLWPGKPMIGLDYAVARGMAYSDAGANQGGVGASISTGMIGQGIVNFGQFLGPLAAAFLMSLWASVLARQDLLADQPGRIFLYAIGFFLTFNLGRDITLLVIYPFCFGWLLLRVVLYFSSRGGGPSAVSSPVGNTSLA